MCDRIDCAGPEQLRRNPAGQPAGASIRTKRVLGDMADVCGLETPDTVVLLRRGGEPLPCDRILVGSVRREWALAREFVRRRLEPFLRPIWLEEAVLVPVHGGVALHCGAAAAADAQARPDDLGRARQPIRRPGAGLRKVP